MPKNTTLLAHVNTPAGRRFVKLLRKAVTYHNAGDPVKDVIGDDDLIEGVDLLLSVLDEQLPQWDKTNV